MLEDLKKEKNYRQLNWCHTVGIAGKELPADATAEDKVCQVALADRKWETMVTGEEDKDIM